MSDWPQDLTQLLRRTIGNGLGGQPVYVADWQSWSVRRLIGPPTAGECAFSSPQLCELLEPVLRISGGWRGRGYATAIDTTGLTECQRIGTALHEASHWLVWHVGCPGATHDQPFVRAALHLWARCPRRVALADIDDALTDRHRQALGRELADRSTPLDKLLSRPAPPAFDDLFYFTDTRV